MRTMTSLVSCSSCGRCVSPDVANQSISRRHLPPTDRPWIRLLVFHSSRDLVAIALQRSHPRRVCCTGCSLARSFSRGNVMTRVASHFVNTFMSSSRRRTNMPSPSNTVSKQSTSLQSLLFPARVYMFRSIFVYFMAVFTLVVARPQRVAQR